MDDEYFKLSLSIRGTAKRPAAALVAAEALRALTRKEQVRFRASFLRGLKEVDIVSNSGIYLGRGGAYNVDLQRLNNVAKRIVRGLYLHHYKRLLPFGDTVEAWNVDGFEESDSITLFQLKSWIGKLKQNEPTEIGNGVFKYWYRRADDDGTGDEHSSLWFLTFYESTHFFGMTVGEHS